MSEHYKIEVVYMVLHVVGGIFLAYLGYSFFRSSRKLARQEGWGAKTCASVGLLFALGLLILGAGVLSGRMPPRLHEGRCGPNAPGITAPISKPAVDTQQVKGG